MNKKKDRIDLSKQPKGLKKAVVHELKNKGFTHHQIARETGIPYGSVKRYALEEYDEQWADFGKLIKKRNLERAGKISELATKRLIETLPKADVRSATGAWKISMDIVKDYFNPQSGGINITDSKVLVLPTELINKYELNQD